MTAFLQFLFKGISVGSLYALIALGYTMVYGILQFAYQGGTFPSPLTRQSRASLPPPRASRAIYVHS